jgi:hypothetical protein
VALLTPCLVYEYSTQITDISGYPAPSAPMRLAVAQAAATGHELVIVGFGVIINDTSVLILLSAHELVIVGFGVPINGVNDSSALILLCATRCKRILWAV